MDPHKHVLAFFYDKKEKNYIVTNSKLDVPQARTKHRGEHVISSILIHNKQYNMESIPLLMVLSTKSCRP